jgi:hypothetical protein
MSDEVGAGVSCPSWDLGGWLQHIQILTQTNRYPLDALQCYAMIRNRIQTVIWTMTEAHMRGQHPSNRRIQTMGVYKIVEA